MFFEAPDAAMTKFDYAATLVASLAWLLHRQRDAVGLVSDFLDDVGPLAEGLGLHDSEGNEVICFHIEDPVERKLPYRGRSVLVGLEEAPTDAPLDGVLQGFLDLRGELFRR